MKKKKLQFFRSRIGRCQFKFAPKVRSLPQVVQCCRFCTMLPQIVQHVVLLQLPRVVNKKNMYIVRSIMYDIDSFLPHNTGWKPADPCNFCIVELEGLKQKPKKNLKACKLLSPCHNFFKIFYVQYMVHNVYCTMQSSLDATSSSFVASSRPCLALAMQDRSLLASDAIRQINQQPHVFNIVVIIVTTQF